MTIVGGATFVVAIAVVGAAAGGVAGFVGAGRLAGVAVCFVAVVAGFCSASFSTAEASRSIVVGETLARGLSEPDRHELLNANQIRTAKNKVALGSTQ